MKPHGPWRIKTSEVAYRDPFIKVRLDQVIRPDGKDGQHVVVNIKAGVCAIPMDDTQNVFLTNEFHYGIGRYSLEGISGGIEAGEDALESARRELQEEAGLAAAQWEFLTAVDPLTTIVVSPVRIYLATELSQAPRNPEGTEQIEIIKIPFAEAIEVVMAGEISHAPTCVAMLMIASKMSG